MSVTESAEELSMEGILACIREIMAEEQAVPNGPHREAGATPLVLTRMVMGDGSVVTIPLAFGPNGQPAPLRTSRDPFSEFELLKQRVAALTSHEVCGRALFAAKNGLVVRSAQPTKRDGYVHTDMVDPASVRAVRPLLVQRGETRKRGSERYPGAEFELDRLCEGSVAPTAVELEPVPNSRRGRVSQKKRKRGMSGREASAGASAVARVETVTTGDFTLDTLGANAATNQIERMLAQQIAAAHDAAMTLTDAALHTIHNESGVARDRDLTWSTVHDAKSMNRIRKRGIEAARLANSAAGMMRAYQEGLATLGMLRGRGRRNTTMLKITDQPLDHAIAAPKLTQGGNGRGPETGRRRRSNKWAASVKTPRSKRPRAQLQ